MMPSISPAEAARLEAVRSYALLDTEPDERLDDLTRIASYIFQTPIALISVVDESRVWFKSRVGFDAQQTPRAISFCAHAIGSEEVTVISDATRDERVADNPLVLSDPRIRFYAGAPLLTPGRHTLGTLCVIDHEPREFDADQKEALAALGRQVMSILELRRELHDQREFLNAVLDGVHEGVVACDVNGNLRLFNRATREFHGLSEEPLPAEQWASRYDLFAADGRTPLSADQVPLARAFQGETVRDEIMVIAPKHRPARTISASGRALHDLSGKKIGAVVTMNDITERKRAEEFLATLSHELKTPMTSILGWVRILQMPETDEQTRASAAHAIEESARAQARLVGDMVDVSSILTGKLQLTFATVNLAAICRTAVESMRPTLEESRIQLSTSIPEEAVEIRADNHRLLQVFWNLISNSAKFTSPGGRVEVALEISGDDVLVRVSDSGKGIPADALPFIFEKFHQAADSRAQGSLGLGLAIVRHIVEAHGGTITAHSEGSGKGAVFSVQLPMPPE